jgi:iron complex outermembrane receptor protein
VNWDFPVPALRGTLRATVEGDYNSGYWTTASNSTPTLRLTPDGPLVTPTALDSYAESFTLMNIALGYDSSDGHWRALLECKNCTDATYLVAVFNGDFYGEPRRINGAITYSF